MKVTHLALPIVGRSCLAFFLLLVSGTSWSACVSAWEYRIVDVSSPHSSMRIERTAKSVAGDALVAALNDLGQAGWELASQHEIRVREEVPTSEGAVSGRWIASLSPPTALFKRSSQQCEDTGERK